LNYPKTGPVVRSNIVVLSRGTSIHTYPAVPTAWYHFTRSQRLYGNLRAPTTTMNCS